MENALISVIVPVYNVAAYLDACVGSLTGQTYKNLEIILIDDGSTDQSGALCDEWEKRDTRIRVVHQKNQGLSAARNRGLEIISGEYVAFLDSDDIIYEDAYRRMVKALERRCSSMRMDSPSRHMKLCGEKRQKTEYSCLST